MEFSIVKNSVSVTGDEYFEFFCEDRDASEVYFKATAGLHDRITELEIAMDELWFEHEQLQESHAERDRLCTALIALCFKLEKCSSVKQVRELINQHRMDRYEDYI